MAGLRRPVEEGEQANSRAQVEVDVAAHYSDDERSTAADSWSVKSEYGSTLDTDDQRQADAEALAPSSFRASDYCSDKEQDVELESSVLGLQSYWDVTYADELTNFREHGDPGEIWFGEEVLETVATWTAKICADIAAGHPTDLTEDVVTASLGDSDIFPEIRMGADLASWNVLDIGTGNGLLLQALSKHGFVDLMGTDYSESGIELARAVAERKGHSNICFLVDDILETKLQKKFKLVTDKGTLDAIGLHPEGSIRRIFYWKAVSKLVAPGGVLVVTSCNSTKDELVDEASLYMQNTGMITLCSKGDDSTSISSTSSLCSDAQPVFHYIDHVRSYPTFRFGGLEGSRVSTVAFLRSACEMI